MRIEQAAENSTAKSRSLTASIEFVNVPVRCSSRAVMAGSVGSEVPAIDTKGSGMLNATYDTASKKLTYTVTYKDLSGPATAAHFHGPADAKSNAGVVVPVKEMTPGTLKGEATLTDAQAADLQGGKWYFNIHTEKNKPGEIRGQVMKK